MLWNSAIATRRFYFSHAIISSPTLDHRDFIQHSSWHPLYAQTSKQFKLALNYTKLLFSARNTYSFKSVVKNLVTVITFLVSRHFNRKPKTSTNALTTRDTFLHVFKLSLHFQNPYLKFFPNTDANSNQRNEILSLYRCTIQKFWVVNQYKYYSGF